MNGYCMKETYFFTYPFVHGHAGTEGHIWLMDQDMTLALRNHDSNLSPATYSLYDLRQVITSISISAGIMTLDFKFFWEIYARITAFYLFRGSTLKKIYFFLTK